MANVILGTVATELLAGSEENDIIYTNGGADLAFGFGGHDTLVQRGGSASVLYGGHGNDIYVVLEGSISISEQMGSGVDTLRTFVTMTADLASGVENIENIFYNAALTLRGNSLDNRIICGAASDAAFGRDGNDVIVGSQVNPSTLFGEEGNDRLIGGDRATFGDTLDGGPGNDILEGRLGPDNLIGAAGNDTYILTDDTSDIITETSGNDTITSTISRTLTNPAIENLTLVNVATALAGAGNNLANLITGNNFSNTLSGGVGNDTLRGLNGNDRLLGAQGNDILTGGLNNDLFVFNTALNASTNRDIVTDFNHVNDTFQLDNAVFTKLAAVGALNPAFFRPGAAALDANDFIVYNQANGALFYDSNGNGAGGAIMFALLTNRPVLLANDFAVI